METVGIECLWIPEKERLIKWLDDRIRLRQESIFHFDDGTQIAETGLLRRIQLTNSAKLQRIANIIGVPVRSTSYSNRWWMDIFEYGGYEFCSMRAKEKTK